MKISSFFALAVIAVLLPLTAFAQDTGNFRLEDARLVISSYLTGDHDRDFGKTLVRDTVMHMIQKFQGEIRITEVDDKTLTVKKTVVPVLVSIKYVGLPFKAEVTTGIMGIHGLRGKQIGDILGSYRGYEVGVGAILNLDEMYLKNVQTGIAINDLQSFILGIGVSATKVQMIISASDAKDSVTRTNAPNGGQRVSTTDLGEVLGHTLR